MMRRFSIRTAVFVLVAVTAAYGVPVKVEPVVTGHGMVVAAHPEAAQIGVDVLQAGGNAIDAAVAVSLALGVAEPYGSGLGGKLMLLFYEAKTGRTFAIDGMDEASRSLDPAMFRRLEDRARYDGWSAVCVPGLAAGLFQAHQRWGVLAWSDNVRPAISLARAGFLILPKTREFFEERIEKLRGGDPDLARLYLPQGELPIVGSRLANEDLARSMELLAREGADGFYRGSIADNIVAASRKGGGILTHEDFALYEARITEPLGITFRGHRILSGPPPTTGGALFLTILKAIEPEALTPPLRSVENLDLIGRIWRVVQPAVQRTIADTEGALGAFNRLTSPEGIARIREQAGLGKAPGRPAAWVAEPESVHASTTHFAVVDAEGNVVCATQSQSLHFGAAVVAAGIVMNNSMSNFAFTDQQNPNFIAAGRRPRSTISPTLVLRGNQPVLAIGIPGASRIPTGVLQGLIDYLVFNRPLEEAIGDTRVHWYHPLQKDQPDAVEAEASLAEETVDGLRALG
ncbi:MAG: gamma-glutamyltransferase family protein, partial [Candidatus Didemnitutus sp.]|nr:gamma-glutamyltransferase family protein [Candidatus Didemnitutus sp.]